MRVLAGAADAFCNEADPSGDLGAAGGNGEGGGESAAALLDDGGTRTRAGIWLISLVKRFMISNAWARRNLGAP